MERYKAFYTYFQQKDHAKFFYKVLVELILDVITQRKYEIDQKI